MLPGKMAKYERCPESPIRGTVLLHWALVKRGYSCDWIHGSPSAGCTDRVAEVPGCIVTLVREQKSIHSVERHRP